MSNEKLVETLRTIAEWNPPPMNDRDGNESSMALEIGSNGVRDYFRGIARNALQANAAEAAQPQAQNSEWVMVPREPTQAMLDANGDSDFPEGKAWLAQDARDTWAAMLAAVPQQAAEPFAWAVANHLDGPFDFRKTKPIGWAVIKPLYTHSAQAQPPAASVPGVSAQAHENAQAALAAQENPNG